MNARAPSPLPRTVVALGVVSLLTDVSTEMIYPLLPLFVVGAVGGGALSLGLIEGVAESTAALVKLGSGALSDRMRRRMPLVLLGYGLAGVARPLIGLARVWPVVLALRFVDRIGSSPTRSRPRRAGGRSACTRPWITPAPSSVRSSPPVCSRSAWSCAASSWPPPSRPPRS
jgi:MFS family permease